MQAQTQVKQEKKCPYCGDKALQQNDQSHVYCTNCGRVLQGISFANEVTFANLRMEGQVIDVNEKSNANTTQKRLKKARAKLQQLKKLLKIQLDGDTALEAAIRVINYANSLNFFDKGKNIEIYAAAAYYMTLRFMKQPYLLIDFSDKMNVNLFKLARCFLKLLRFLGFQNQLPLIDPSIYISRYCKMLQLGDKTRDVAMTATKLVQRMKRDWMCQGRRPSSLCGAAILIATKIHDLSCSTSQICKTVFVCDETIRRRLEQFKQTSVAKLTKQQFEKMGEEINHVGQEMDPPAFIRARMKSQQQHIKKKIMEEMEAVPCKDKLEKIPWEKYRDNLNIPEQILAKQVKGVQKELQFARQRYEQQSNSQQIVSNYTQDIFEQESSQLDDQKEEKQVMEQKQEEHIDEQQIQKFILDQDERRMKKNLWMKHNEAWIQKQNAKKKDEERNEKKKSKRKVKAKQGKDIYESIGNTKLGNAVNPQQLKRLIGSEPHKPEEENKGSLRLEKLISMAKLMNFLAQNKNMKVFQIANREQKVLRE